MTRSRKNEDTGYVGAGEAPKVRPLTVMSGRGQV